MSRIPVSLSTQPLGEHRRTWRRQTLSGCINISFISKFPTRILPCVYYFLACFVLRQSYVITTTMFLRFVFFSFQGYFLLQSARNVLMLCEWPWSCIFLLTCWKNSWPIVYSRVFRLRNTDLWLAFSLSASHVHLALLHHVPSICCGWLTQHISH